MWSKILALASVPLMVLTSTPPALAQVSSTPQTSGGIAGTAVFPSLESTAPGSVTGFGTVASPGTTIQNGTTTTGSTTSGASSGTAGGGGTGTGGGGAGIPGGGGSCIDAIFGVIC